MGLKTSSPVCERGGRDVERYRLLGIEHGGRESASARVVSREPNKWGVFPLHTFNSGDEVVLAADAQATIAALQAELERTKFEMASELELQVNAVVREREQLKAKLTQRTAELERVTGELVETSLYLQQERANRDSLAACVGRDVKTIKELRALILALPKVEGRLRPIGYARS